MEKNVLCNSLIGKIVNNEEQQNKISQRQGRVCEAEKKEKHAVVNDFV